MNSTALPFGFLDSNQVAMLYRNVMQDRSQSLAPVVSLPQSLQHQAHHAKRWVHMQNGHVSPVMNSMWGRMVLQDQYNGGRPLHVRNIPGGLPGVVCSMPGFSGTNNFSNQQQELMRNINNQEITASRSPVLATKAVSPVTVTGPRKRPYTVVERDEEFISKKLAMGPQLDLINNTVGERRLIISFESLGELGNPPQSCGKSGIMLPHGLRGTHKVYGEHWRFEIIHGKEIIDPEGVKCCCITWKLTNLNNGMSHSATETDTEAISRASVGRTLTNKIFREALEYRAAELEASLEKERDELRRGTLVTLIKALRPKRVSIGPLVFGLQHKIVQDKMKELADMAQNKC